MTLSWSAPEGYPIGAKRLCRDTDYFGTFNCENVSLADLREDPLVSIEQNGVRTQNGFCELDVLVLATGFDALTGRHWPSISRVPTGAR